MRCSCGRACPLNPANTAWVALFLASLSLPVSDGERCPFALLVTPNHPTQPSTSPPECWGGRFVMRAGFDIDLPLTALRGGRKQDAAAIMRAATQNIADTQLQKAITERLKKEMQAKVQAQVQAKVQKAIEANLKVAAERIEQRIDDRLREEGEMSEEEVERLREERVKRVKRAAMKRREYLGKGHGAYEEVDERDFFARVKASPKVIVHFYRPTTFRCQILDSHLKELAQKHLDCLFIKLNVEKTPFLVDKLRIRVLPCLKLVKGGEIVHTMIGFEEFGNSDDFKTRELVAALARRGFLRESATEEDSGDVEDFDLDVLSED